ncbi:MAG: tetratricopeptide repeat protein [Candidatus Sumerlaeaceae bacterium]|nr:tetratricopeptide repeat protein [Candidatus Sumerlaeaceae bacterium]
MQRCCVIRRSWRAWAVVMLFVAMLGTAASATASRVILNSGREVSGAILSETPREVVIKTDVGVLRFARSEIRQIIKEDTLPDEVAAEREAAQGHFDEALRKFAAALEQAPAGSAARARIESKINALTAERRRLAEQRISRQMAQARALVAARDYEGALKEAAAVRAAAGDDEAVTSAVARLIAEIHLVRAQQARDRMAMIDAAAEMKKAVEADPSYYPAQLAYGEMLLGSSVTEAEGIERLEQGLAAGKGQISDEDLVKYNYILGRRYFAREKYEAAADRFASCIGASSKGGEYADALDWAVKSYLKLGERTRLGDIEKTIANLNRALKLNPENKDALFFLGSLYRDNGDTSGAVATLTQLVKLDPKYPRAHFSLASAYLERGELEQALKHFDEEVKLDPLNDEALTDRADVHIQMANYEKAEEDLKRAMQIQRDKWRPYLLYAQMAFAKEEFDKAKQNLNQVLRIKPDSVEANILMGRVLVAEKDYAKAREWFQTVVTYLQKLRNPSFRFRKLMAEAQTSLGEIDLIEDSPRSAETRFREALDFIPDYAPAFNKIGDVRRRLANEQESPEQRKALFNEALQYYAKAIEANPRDPNFYLSLAILYHKDLKQPEQALENYKTYLDKGGRDKANVEKWIQEVTMGETETETTGTEAVTTGTAAGEGATTAPAVTEGPTTATAADAGTTPTTGEGTTTPSASANPAPTGEGQPSAAAVAAPPAAR